MKIFHYRKIKAEKANEGASKLKVRWLISKDIGAENFAMRLFEMEPEGFSPLHNHPWEHEVFILEGRGLVRGRKEERNFRKGDVIFIPSNEAHQFQNTGEKTVKFLCIVPNRNK